MHRALVLCNTMFMRQKQRCAERHSAHLKICRKHLAYFVQMTFKGAVMDVDFEGQGKKNCLFGLLGFCI